MKAVSNSSVLIALSAIQQLDLLQQRFPDGIMIPQAVWHEVVTTGGGRPGSQAVATASFIQVRSITNTPLAQVLQAELDYGEAEAIALLLENHTDALLLDEKSVRRVAARIRLPVLGTVGILIWARQHSLITNLRAQLDLLTDQGGFRLSERIYNRALQQVGE